MCLDPFQSTQWEGAGRENVRKAGLSHVVELREVKSFLGLPKLLEEGKRFQAIFIDGMHLYDYTLVDFFYADLLLDVGGVILLDDIRHAGVAACMKYLVTNYPHLSLIRDTPCADSLATFWKTGEDTRWWDFHVPFF